MTTFSWPFKGFGARSAPLTREFKAILGIAADEPQERPQKAKRPADTPPAKPAGPWIDKKQRACDLARLAEIKQLSKGRRKKEGRKMHGKIKEPGFTRAQLARWGVPWPPPKGWKKKLEAQGIVCVPEGKKPKERGAPLGDRWTQETMAAARQKVGEGRLLQVGAVVRGERLVPVMAIAEDVCAWPGCGEPALCRSGNFGGELVCGAHFSITNSQALVGAEEHTHVHRDGSSTVTRSAAGSLEEISSGTFEAGILPATAPQPANPSRQRPSRRHLSPPGDAGGQPVRQGGGDAPPPGGRHLEAAREGRYGRALCGRRGAGPSLRQ